MPNNRFLNALQGKPQKIPPIWLMRQAGRYHSHYQNLKKNFSFEELCKSPHLAAETAMGPIEEFDFDVAILFSDILFPLESLGMNLKYDPGPQFSELLSEQNHGKIFSQNNPIQSLSFQAEAIERTIEKLPNDKSMTGFIGGPWTLVSYAMGKNKKNGTDKLSKFEWNIINDKLIPLLKQNVSMQLEAGAEIVMIFDSAANQLNEIDFEKYMRIVFKEIVSNFEKKVGYYAKDGVNYSSIEMIKTELSVPLAGLGIDSNESLIDFFNPSRKGFIQGNFDEKIMIQPPEIMKENLDKFIEKISSVSIEERVGWVCGLGHGVLKTTPEENVKFFVKKIRESFA